MPLDLKPLVEAIRGLPPLADEDGETRTVEVLPPGTPDELERFAVACGGALPAELEEFLSLSAGLRGVLEFEPEPHLRECARVNTLRVYDYGNGDWMGLEPGDARCRIWWLGHDPYFMVLHAESITSLLQTWLETISGLIEAGTSLDELDLFRPAVESRGLSRSDVPCADDAALAAFLERLPEGSLVHDLRRAAPRTEIPIESSQGGGVERHGTRRRYEVPPLRSPWVAPRPER